MDTGKKIDSIILLRAVAILLVVFAHATRNALEPNVHMYDAVLTPIWEVSVKKYIYSFHMPLFFWISGYVFYFSSIERNKEQFIYKEYIKKIKRLIIPLYATSFLILLPSILILGHVNGTLVHQIKELMLANDNDHLWFLKTLFVIFILAIPCAKFSKKLTIFPCLFLFILWIGAHEIHLAVISKVVLFLPFFVIGSLNRKFEKYFIGRFDGSLCLALIVFHYSLFLMINDVNIIPKIILWYIDALFGLYYMYFLTTKLTSYIERGSFWRVVKILDNASYGIYLFHVVFIYLVLYIMNVIQIELPIVRVLLSFVGGTFFAIIVNSFLSQFRMTSLLFGMRVHIKSNSVNDYRIHSRS